MIMKLPQKVATLAMVVEYHHLLLCLCCGRTRFLCGQHRQAKPLCNATVAQGLLTSLGPPAGVGQDPCVVGVAVIVVPPQAMPDERERLCLLKVQVKVWRPALPACSASQIAVHHARLKYGSSAAGVGLDFSAASMVVFVELPQEVALVRQAEDRAHRHGQRNPVNVYFLMAKGTCDERRWVLCHRHCL